MENILKNVISKQKKEKEKDQDPERDSFLGEFGQQETILNQQVLSSGRSKRTKTVKTRNVIILLSLFLSVAINVYFYIIFLLLSNPATCVFETDIKDTHRIIQYEQRLFTGSLSYDWKTNRTVRAQDAKVKYFGYPSQEIDVAWKHLLSGGFPEMTEEEAQEFTPELKRLPITNKYHFEPDVFHSLHCLNEIRTQVSLNLYNLSNSEIHHMQHHHDINISWPKDWHRVHMEHCMDRIRQALMCHADLTPSPLYLYPGTQLALGKSGRHTCRKWEPIMNWTRDRKGRGVWLPPL